MRNGKSKSRISKNMEMSGIARTGLQSHNSELGIDEVPEKKPAQVPSGLNTQLVEGQLNASEEFRDSDYEDQLH